MVDYFYFQKSLKHLEEQYNNYLLLDHKPYLTQLDKDAIAESVIQRFETCYDSLWKVVKRYLNQELGIPEVPNSPKPIFRIAAENNLFASDIRQWLNYSDTRISTSHDYSGDNAKEALAIMNQFIADAIELYKTMTNNQWD